MRLRSLLLLGFAAAIPTAAPAAQPPAAPPIDLVLPDRARGALADLLRLFPLDRRDPIPVAAPGNGPPDLVDVFDLPERARRPVFELAPSAGGRIDPVARAARRRAAFQRLIPVPEPGTAALLLLGLSGLALRRRG